MMKTLVRIVALWASLFPLVTVGFAQSDPLKVVTTTTQAADLARVLAGDLIELTPLMGAGVDPHLYKPTESDIVAMNEADMIVTSGLHLEGQFGEVLESLAESNVVIVTLGEEVKKQGFVLKLDMGNDVVVDDPHFWFDPRNFQLATTTFADALSATDPTHAETYQANATDYLTKLDLLFTWAQEALAQIPSEQRVLVTSHDAFGYYADAFGLEVRSVQGISTADEAGVGDIQAVVDFIVERNVPVLFVESSVPPQTINAVQQGVLAKGGKVDLGVRVLYSDAMGEVDAFGGNYLGMIAENTLTILQSFGLPVPPLPDELGIVFPAELLEEN